MREAALALCLAVVVSKQVFVTRTDNNKSGNLFGKFGAPDGMTEVVFDQATPENPVKEYRPTDDEFTGSGKLLEMRAEPQRCN